MRIGTARDGYLLIALAAALWGSLGVVSRIVLQAGLEPVELSFWRAALAGTLFAAESVIRGRTRVALSDLPVVAAFGVGGVAIFYLSFQYAVRDGGAALASILLYTAPAWVALASAIWLGERISPRTLLALAMTLAGAALVAVGAGGAAGGIQSARSAVVCGLVSGVAYAGYYLFGKRYFTRYAPATLYMYALPLGALLLLPAVEFAPRSASTWGWIAFVAVVPTYLALHVYSAGLRRLEATRAVTVATLEPVIAAGMAFLVWGESLRPAGYLGAALVIGGVLVMTGQSVDAVERGGERHTL